MKVLLAEDDVVSAHVLQDFLEKWGHEVIAAEDGAEAWRLFQEHDIALVITDWIMPNLDGLELVRRIRATPRPGYVYVILLTAKARKEDTVRGMEAGADDFLTKPFDRDELRARLRAGERVVKLEQDVARRNAELQAANKRMKRDLEAAARIQQALLPTTLPECDCVQFAWRFQPCEELAGDIFGVVPLDDRYVALYLLDVSGHGVAAALLSVTVRHVLSPTLTSSSILRQAVPGTNHFTPTPPAEVARELNSRFPTDPATGQYFTLLYGVLDLHTLEFRYVCAGHPGPVHLPWTAEPLREKVSGFPIGLIEDAAYDERVLPLRPRDRLYFYSDGILEAANPSGESFGIARMLDSVAGTRLISLDESLERLTERVMAWTGRRRMADDVSLLAVEVRGM
jgi:sigma-B regulation protein RsbU (phosphoserine phosphatase)